MTMTKLLNAIHIRLETCSINYCHRVQAQMPHLPATSPALESPVGKSVDMANWMRALSAVHCTSGTEWESNADHTPPRGTVGNLKRGAIVYPIPPPTATATDQWSVKLLKSAVKKRGINSKSVLSSYFYTVKKASNLKSLETNGKILLLAIYLKFYLINVIFFGRHRIQKAIRFLANFHFK